VPAQHLLTHGAPPASYLNAKSDATGTTLVNASGAWPPQAYASGAAGRVDPARGSRGGHMHGDVDTHHTTKLKGQDRSRSKFQRSSTSKPESFTTFMWDPIASFAVPKTRYVLKVAANCLTPAAHCSCTDAKKTVGDHSVCSTSRSRRC